MFYIWQKNFYKIYENKEKTIERKGKVTLSV